MVQDFLSGMSVPAVLTLVTVDRYLTFTVAAGPHHYVFTKSGLIGMLLRRATPPEHVVGVLALAAKVALPIGQVALTETSAELD